MAARQTLHRLNLKVTVPLTVPGNPSKIWVGHRAAAQGLSDSGSQPWSLSGVPHVEPLQRTELAENVSPPASQTSTSAEGVKSAPSAPQPARRCADSFDAVFDTLTEYDGYSDLPNYEQTDQVFEEALDAGLDVASQILTLCRSAVRDTSNEEGSVEMLSEAERLCNFKPKSEKVIALLGRSGEGKSSLINSLLGYGELVPMGDTGSACTSVVTELRQKDQRHKSKITLEVEYYTEAETQELLADLVKDFRTAQLLPEAPSAEDLQAAPRNEDLVEARSNEAWSALEAAFGHHKLFGRSFLLDRSSGALDRITSQLVQWTQLLQWPSEARDGRFSIAANGEDDCVSKISLLMQDKFWPFTKIIRIFLDSDVLRSGIVLTDLPGRSDTNAARVKAGQMYLRNCDHVFVLSDVKRAISDASLKSSVFEMLAREMPVQWELNRGRNLQVTVICTKTDDILIAANKRVLIPTNSPAFESCIKNLEEETTLNKDPKKQKVFNTEIKSLLIKARNNAVASRLRQSFQSEDPEKGLHVFCVSSKMYNKSAIKTDAPGRIRELSGIPVLRTFCRSLNRLDRQKEISNFIQNRLLGLLTALDLCSQTTVSRIDAQTATEVWKDTQEKIRWRVSEAGAEIKKTILGIVTGYFENRAGEWRSAALDQSAKWKPWHFKQYDTFCYNHGDHSTTLIPPTNWNRDIIWKMAQELNDPLQDVDDDVSTSFGKLLSAVREEIDSLVAIYEEGGLPEAVIQGLKSCLGNLIFTVLVANHNLKEQVEKLRRSALEANRASYVVQHMMPGYRCANSQRGNGMKQRQVQAVEDRIRLQLFPALQQEIGDSLSRLIDSTFSDLQEQLRPVFGVVQHGFGVWLEGPVRLQQANLYDASFVAQVQQLLRNRENIARKIDATRTTTTQGVVTSSPAS